MIDRATRLLGASIPKDIESHLLTAPFLNGRGRTITFEYVLTPGSGNCR
jgi:hypothetical protein